MILEKLTTDPLLSLLAHPDGTRCYEQVGYVAQVIQEKDKKVIEIGQRLYKLIYP